MFTIRRGKFEYYSEDGGFVTLAEWEVIRWFPHYVTASQHMMKLGGSQLEVADSRTILEELLKGAMGLAPELIRFASGRSREELIEVSQMTEIAALRGGILEHKDTIKQLEFKLESLSKREQMLLAEAERLSVTMSEYGRVVKEIGS